MSNQLAEPRVPVAGLCGRCRVVVVDGEVCWWCQGPLCRACWEAHGHCGHAEAEAENERARRVPQPPGHPDHGRIPA